MESAELPVADSARPAEGSARPEEKSARPAEGSARPLVSVLLPFHRAGMELDVAIGSIVDQTFRNWELLLIDNNANEAALQIARNRVSSDSRIRLIHEPSQGIAHALNKGLSVARGELIARMDADDYSYSQRLARQVEFLSENPDAGAVATQTEFCSTVPKSHGFRLFVAWQNAILGAGEHFLSRFIESPLAHPTICFRKSLTEKFGSYDTGRLPEDYELWLRWMDRGVRICKLPERLLRWNDHPGRLSRNHENYAREAFFGVKCRYLARWILRELPAHKKVIVCGSSPTGRKRAQLLTRQGVEVYGFTDVKYRGIAPLRFIPMEAIREPEPWFIVNLITKRGVGFAIRRHFGGLGFQEGRDFILAG